MKLNQRALDIKQVRARLHVGMRLGDFYEHWGTRPQPPQPEPMPMAPPAQPPQQMGPPAGPDVNEGAEAQMGIPTEEPYGPQG